MKISLLIFAFLAACTGYAQTLCNNNSAQGFPCENFDLMATLTPSQMDAIAGNDSWGWTDPDTGKEYALMGLNNGTAFVDITDPINIVYLGKLPTHNNFLDGGQIWRDIKIYNNHAYVVSEIDNHGMQVFDLTRLRNVANPPQVFTEDAHYDGFGRCHNIVINEQTGFVAAVGTLTFNSGAHFVDISNPTNPLPAGGYGANGYMHDAQIVVYDGPDPDHQGKEILIGSNTDEVIILDVSTISSPQLIASVSYSNEGYTHQGWFTEDQSHFIVNDETDEIISGFMTRTLVFDFIDLDNPSFKFEYFGDTTATDHNLYVKGDRAYMANYSEGLRVMDISDIANSTMTEVGTFDTYPEDNGVGTSNGIWSLYPYFESGNIVLSDSNRGLFIVRESNTLGVENTLRSQFSLLPNPATEKITISGEESLLKTIAVYDVTGRQVLFVPTVNALSKEVSIADLSAGIYMVLVNEQTTLRLLKE